MTRPSRPSTIIAQWRRQSALIAWLSCKRVSTAPTIGAWFDSIERLGVKNTRGIAVVDQSITLNALRDMDLARRARNPVQRHHWPDAD